MHDVPAIIYQVRPGENNTELKYSLRSLRNIAHGRVIIAGHVPAWINREQVTAVPVAQRAGQKHRNAEANLSAALDVLEDGEDFYLFNDDFYVIERIEWMPVLHRGPLDDVIAAHQPGRYRSAMEATRKLLSQELGIGNLLSYELHIPMLFERTKLQLTLNIGSDIPAVHYRTLYGNIWNVGGVQTHDFKVYRPRDDGWRNWPFLSTNDNILSSVGDYLAAVFPTASVYEVQRVSTGRQKPVRYHETVYR